MGNIKPNSKTKYKNLQNLLQRLWKTISKLGIYLIKDTSLISRTHIFGFLSTSTDFNNRNDSANFPAIWKAIIRKKERRIIIASIICLPLYFENILPSAGAFSNCAINCVYKNFYHSGIFSFKKYIKL